MSDFSTTWHSSGDEQHFGISRFQAALALWDISRTPATIHARSAIRLADE